MSCSFHWQLDGLDRSRFAALVNLLSMRQGGQMDPPMEAEHVGETGETVPEERKLRMRFLDRFAELVSRDKGAEHVSCTMLRETGGKIEVWVSRNTGLATEDDRRFFGDFERLMPNVRKSEEARVKLWNAMLHYYRPRLYAYIKKLEDLGQPEHPALYDLYRFLSYRANWTDENEMLSQLVDRAEELLGKYPNASKLAVKAWKYIEFLARVRRAHKTFIKCARKFEKFRYVTIIQVQNQVDGYTPVNPWSLDQLLEHLEITGNNTFVQTHIAKTTKNSRGRRDMVWARDRFRFLSEGKAFIHAEVRLLLFILQSPFPMEHFFDYMGCSKDNCFMCSLFLRHFGGLTSRGSHLRVHNLWTIPDTWGLTLASSEKLVGVVNSMENELVREVERPISGICPGYQPQSTIGKPSSGNSGPISEATVLPQQDPVTEQIAEDHALEPHHTATEGEGDQTPRQATPVLQNASSADLYLNERPPSPELESNVEPSVVGGEDANTGADASAESANPVDEVKELEEEKSEDEKKESAAYPSPPPSEPCCDTTPKLSPTVKSDKLATSKPASLKSSVSAPTVPSKDTFYKKTSVPKEPKTPEPRSSTSSWQGVYQYLVDTVTAMPTVTLRKSVEDCNTSGDLDEIALSIWTLQSHKRFLRSIDPVFSSNPKRLFIPPNAAQVIESALLNGYRGSACDMLKKLWLKLNPVGPPEHVVILINKEGHWVVHCMDLATGRVVSYGTYYDCEWTKLQSRVWWPALNEAWPLKLDADAAAFANRALYHHQRDPPEGNSVAIAAIWYKILMGIPVQRSVDLPRLRDLIRREVVSVVQRKQMGDLRVIH